jgi:hypothetical protein
LPFYFFPSKSIAKVHREAKQWGGAIYVNGERQNREAIFVNIERQNGGLGGRSISVNRERPKRGGDFC